MTSTLQRIEGPGDAELIAAVRGGDNDAYGLLFERHVDAARRLARQLVPGSDADDLVSEAFAKVLTVLQRGEGPDLAFRAYLLTAVRRLHIDKVRGAARLHTTDDLTPFDPGVPFHDTVIEGFENAAAARAFASLPERWQMVLWHTSVEGQKPADVAPLLGMSANSVAALAYRAREGLRQAFLTMHVETLDDDTCEWVRQNIGGYLRGGTSRRDVAKVEAHLDECRPCMAIYLELTEVNSNLAAWLAPIVLGAAGAGYLATTGSVGVGGAVIAMLDRAKDVVIGKAVASTAAAGVAATVVVGGVMITGNGPELQLAGDPPVLRESVDEDQPSATKPQAVQRDRVVRRERDDREPARRQAGTRQGSDGPRSAGAGDATETPAAAGDSAPDSSTDDPTGVGGTQEPAGQQPEEPQAEEPQPVTYDVALSASSEPGKGASTRITVTVTGVPAGMTGSLSAEATGAVSLSSQRGDGACRRQSPTAFTCGVSDSATVFVFGAQSPAPGSITFTVTLAEGTDTNAANNSVTVGIAGNA
ncbi:sigma-70 family RNA polymerase sigma factor [Nocardioides sp.]|uniref:sigma-70 family RNA polymerase sigma factor n=1 Tax=Nocardioides sp. TaxID=35761 RepID=UPI002ED4A23A